MDVRTPAEFASGARSEQAAATLASHGIAASSLTGGTEAWAAEATSFGRAAAGPRAIRAMERQVRQAAHSCATSSRATSCGALPPVHR